MSKQTEYTLKISLELAYGNVSITCESDDEDAPYIGGCGKSLEEALSNLSTSIDEALAREED
jgi:hypothetical protein